ncbi:50S ribosomal protein L15e [Caldiplasma sukawensis]
MRTVNNLYGQISQEWKNMSDNGFLLLQRQRMIAWRNGLAVERLERPTRLDRARNLGYRAKSGYIIVRSRVRKGGANRPKIMGGRRPRRLAYNKLTRKKSIQWIAEERAADKYPNMEVLNSYYVGEDGFYKYYEVMLVDKNVPEVYNDKRISWIGEPQNKGRVYRGLTSAGYKGRGLRTGRTKSAKSRPSIRSNGRLRR